MLIRDYFTLFAAQLFFLTSFFVSFAINFSDYNWGLQASWVIVFFIISINPSYLISSIKWFASRKIIICGNRIKTLELMRMFIVFSLCSNLLLFTGGIDPDAIDINYCYRSIVHTAYLSFFFLACAVTVHIFVNLGYGQDSVIKLLRVSFLIISVYGTQQILATYGIIPLVDILNNSLSTGFTYLRFVDDHRVSSSFPEPSEYSYYLCLLVPYIYIYARRLISIKSYLNALVVISLLIIQLIFIKSVSFLVGLPIVVFTITNYIEKIDIKRYVAVISIILIGMTLIVAMLVKDRIELIFNGSDGSISDRFDEFMLAIHLFEKSPIIGYGYGAIRGMDFYSFSLASFGLIGFSLIMYKLMSILVCVRKLDPVKFGSLLAALSSAFSSSNPFDYVWIWLVMCVFEVHNFS